jgi:hypothetical protein
VGGRPSLIPSGSSKTWALVVLTSSFAPCSTVPLSRASCRPRYSDLLTT